MVASTLGETAPHHEERGQYERESDERRAEHAPPHPADVDRKLGGERSGRKLREREPLHVVFARYPASALDEVPLHVARQSNRAAKAERAQVQKVAHELPLAARAQLGTREDSAVCGRAVHVRAFFARATAIAGESCFLRE